MGGFFGFGGGSGEGSSTLVDVTKFNAPLDGTSDATQAFADAIASGERIFVPNHDFVAGGLNISTDVHLSGPGRIIVPNGAPFLTFAPAWGPEVSITSIGTTTIGNQVVTRITADASQVQVGDKIKIYSQDTCSFNTQVWRAEIAEVRRKAVDNTTFDLERQLVLTYTTSPVFRVLPKQRLNIEGLRLKAQGDINDYTTYTNRAAGIVVVGAVHASLRGIFAEASWERVFELHSCWMGDYDLAVNQAPDRLGSNIYGYGIAVMNGTTSASLRVRASRTRHAVSGGAYAWGSYPGVANYAKSGPTWNNLVHDSISQGGNGGGAFDTHEPCINWRFVNCHVMTPSVDPLATDYSNPIGFINRGVFTKFIGCTVQGPTNSNGAGFNDRMANYDWSSVTTAPKTQFDACSVDRCGLGLLVSGATTTSGVAEVIVNGFTATDVDGVNNSGIKGDVGFQGRVVVNNPAFIKTGSPMVLGDAQDWDINGAYVDMLGQSQAQNPITVSNTGTCSVRVSNLTIRQRNTSTPGGVVRNTNATLNLYLGKVFSDRPNTIPAKHASSTGTVTINSLDQDLVYGTAAPTITPWRIGARFVDTTNRKSYTAVGLTNADWVADS